MEILIESNLDFEDRLFEAMCDGHQPCNSDSCLSEDCLVGAYKIINLSTFNA